MLCLFAIAIQHALRDVQLLLRSALLLALTFIDKCYVYAASNLISLCIFGCRPVCCCFCFFLLLRLFYAIFELRLPDIGFAAAGRYVVLAASGDLYVRSVRSEDGLVKLSCLVTNTLNGDRQRSEAVMLQVKGKAKSKLIGATMR